MPMYQYRCKKCGKETEAFQKMSDRPLVECQEEDCNGKLDRLIGASSFRLKGSGWYKDGYQ